MRGCRARNRRRLHGTPRDNLVHAARTRTRSASAKRCGRSVSRNLPSAFRTGLHTEAGDRGLRLSGGERRRVAIARALPARPEPLLLDEPTSQPDPVSARELTGVLRETSWERALLVVAHRGSGYSGIEGAAAAACAAGGAGARWARHKEGSTKGSSRSALSGARTSASTPRIRPRCSEHTT